MTFTIEGKIIADDPRSPLEQAIDELVEEMARRFKTGFIIGDLQFTDVTATVIFSMHDGKLTSHPMVLPAQALVILRDQINVALGARAMNEAPSTDTPQ